MQIFSDRRQAGVIQIDHSFLIALAQYPKPTFVHIHVLYVDSHQLTEPDAAVEKQHQYAVIPLWLIGFHGGQHPQAFLQGQELWQAVFDAGQLQMLRRVLLQQGHVIGQVGEKALDCGGFAASGTIPVLPVIL